MTQPTSTQPDAPHVPSRPISPADREIIRSILGKQHHLTDPGHLTDRHLTPGQRVADAVARTMGSWTFIIIQSVILFGWITINIIGWIREWDPYPFILLNLALSFQAAYSAPIIMMSQNRQALKDRLAAEHDYKVNLHAEMEVSEVRAQLQDLGGRQWNELVARQSQQLELLQRIEHLTAEVHRLTVKNRPGGDDSPPEGSPPDS